MLLICIGNWSRVVFMAGLRLRFGVDVLIDLKEIAGVIAILERKQIACIASERVFEAGLGSEPAGGGRGASRFDPAGHLGLEPARRERPRAAGSRADAPVLPEQRDVPRARVGWHTPLRAERPSRGVSPNAPGKTRFEFG